MTCHFGRLILDQFKWGFPVDFRWVRGIIGRIPSLCGRREPNNLSNWQFGQTESTGTGHTQPYFFYIFHKFESFLMEIAV